MDVVARDSYKVDSSAQPAVSAVMQRMLFVLSDLGVAVNFDASGDKWLFWNCFSTIEFLDRFVKHGAPSRLSLRQKQQSCCMKATFQQYLFGWRGC